MKVWVVTKNYSADDCCGGGGYGVVDSVYLDMGDAYRRESVIDLALGDTGYAQVDEMEVVG